ncbi:acyltransferase family protein [Desulfofundulus thermobenzoicus]|uniref:Acyltransferase family protein n=1 Tax=Desulfofundulus thermobenzoicus TaxID=29376 RepID=A0A6N7IMX9_9FIRM|nr:acyltransferase family protein [Desulfofundulus thermobenzoicus]MQL51320.1 acyltransferase family protein [Desulfofundulus thermobenzoicus]
MPEPVRGNGRYMAGLDGLRALAVLAVIAYHLNLRFAPGGFLGVGVFFVLSGYLITDLLVAEWQGSGQINLKNFWLRRARRLLPALMIMLVVLVSWITLFDPARLTAVRGDVLAAMLYVSNWWLIFHQVSYFDRFGPPSPLGHLWSLAVEEQFYLLWPLLLWCGLRHIPRRGPLVGLTLAGAAASALAMAVIYQPGSDPSRVYYGTDTRAFALLIGAALALVWPSRKLSGKVSPRVRLGIDLAGSIGLLTVLLMIWQTNQYDIFLYRGGLLLLSAATAVLVAALAHPASRLGKALGWQPLRWLGVRSYGIYLWHYPVIVLTSPVVDTGGVNLVRAGLQVAACIALAALSWRYVEEPIRRSGLQKLWKQVPGRAHHRQGRLSIRTWVVPAATLFALGVFCMGMTGSISTITSTVSPGSVSAAIPGSIQSGPDNSGGSDRSGKTLTGSPVNPGPGQGRPPEATGGAKTAASGTTAVGPGAAPTGESREPDQPPGNSGTPGPSPDTPAPVGVAPGRGVTAIGDSLLTDAEPYLREMLPGIVIDAKISRQLMEARTVVDELKLQGRLGNRVIIELGTNGPFTREQLVSLLDSLGPVQQVVLVNTRVPRPWERVVNTTLAQVAATYPHTTLVDWYAASAGHDSFFAPDGVHLTPAGARFYAALVAGAVQPDKG